MTSDYLEERSKRGNRQKFVRAMSKVRGVDPEKKDAL